MKKSSVILILTSFVFITTCYYLLPERVNLTIEAKLRDTLHDEQVFKNDALKQHDTKINQLFSKELTDIRIANETNVLLLCEAIKASGANSAEIKNMYAVKRYQDSIHTKKVTTLIDKYGWLGADKIGAQNNYTLFAVMQNADLKTQGNYLTVMEQAVKSGTLAPQLYASLVDRKAIVEHQQQIYGTQIAYSVKTGKNTFVKIIDSELVNLRRKQIGLTSLKVYATQNNVAYDVM